MATARALAQAHIAAEATLRSVTIRAVENLWASLPAYNRENLDEWLSRVVPVVLAAQRQSVTITEAYLARALDRRPLGLDVAEVVGSIRGGVSPDEVYGRPFVTIWTALGNGTPYADAMAAGLARATGTAAMDVQMAMRAAADAVDAADETMFGYQRVADPGACDFCQEVDGAYVKGSDGFVMALHNNCGCGLEPLTEPHPRAVHLPDGTQVRPYQYGPLNDKVAVHDHGELGPVLGSPDHDFTQL